jgi:hypothetical protein
MSEKKNKLTVTVTPVLRPRKYEAGESYPAHSLGNLLVRRAGVNSKHVINCKDVDTRAYFRGLADAGMIHAGEVVALLDKADELVVTWELYVDPKAGGGEF